MGFLYIGSGFIIFTQMGIALSQSALTSSVVVTIIFALLPIILGIALIRVALRARGEVTMHARIKMAALGVVGLFVWAGLIIGPVLTVVASLLPSVASRNP